MCWRVAKLVDTSRVTLEFQGTQRNKKRLLVYLDTVSKMTSILLMLLYMSPCFTQLGFGCLQKSTQTKERLVHVNLSFFRDFISDELVVDQNFNELGYLICFNLIFWQMFVDEVMDLVELNPLRDSLVGLPGVNGLSTEQRKRLTIAVELVANPSIIFMDEPTSGLDARAAAIVMRTVRNTVDTGRTVVCTIHQPSIDIFEAFDEVKTLFRFRLMN